MIVQCTFDVAPSEAKFIPAGQMSALVGEIVGLHLGQGDQQVAVSIGRHRSRVVPLQVHSLPCKYKLARAKKRKRIRSPVIEVYRFPIWIVTLVRK